MDDLSGSDPGPRGQTRSDRAAEVASRQWGVIGADQLHTCGVDPKTVSRWLEGNRLHRIHRGVYALGHSSVPIEGRLVAALMHAGRGAVLSHATAVWWWGLIPHEPQRIDVSSPNDVKSIKGVLVHHPRQITATRHRRLPVTPIPQTLLDFASASTLERVRFALAEADYRKLLNVDEVKAVLGQGRPGSRALRHAIAVHEPKYAFTRSGLEQAFLALCERHRIPLPQLNVKIEGWLVDAVWPGERVVVELDGYLGHRTRAQLERDHQRDLELRAAAFKTARYTATQITDHPKQVAADVKMLLGKR